MDIAKWAVSNALASKLPEPGRVGGGPARRRQVWRPRRVFLGKLFYSALAPDSQLAAKFLR